MLRFKRYFLEEAAKPATKKPKVSWTEKLVKQVNGIAQKSKKAGATEQKKKTEKKPVSKWDKPHDPGTTVHFVGRFNPITSGHVNAVQKAQQYAEKIGAKFEVIVPHHTKQDERNPLDQKTKMGHIKAALPGVNVVVADKDKPSIMHQVKRAYDSGTKNYVLFAGGDRTKEYETLLNNYNRTPAGGYNFNSIKVQNAGKRGPGIVSGTQQRDYAASGDWESFRQGSPFPKDFVRSRQLMRDTADAMKRVNRANKRKK